MKAKAKCIFSVCAFKKTNCMFMEKIEFSSKDFTIRKSLRNVENLLQLAKLGSV